MRETQTHRAQSSAPVPPRRNYNAVFLGNGKKSANTPRAMRTDRSEILFFVSYLVPGTWYQVSDTGIDINSLF